jgi:hypothetical protein
MRLYATRQAAIGYGRGLGDALWDLAGVPASLDQRFAQDRSLIDAVSGQQLITFTRASDGTFVGSNGLIQTAGTNVPRFTHDPVTLGSLGLLVEEQRSNLLRSSEDFSTTWSRLNVAAFGSGSVADAIAAPDGATTADLIVDDATNAAHYVFQQLSVAASTPYTFSVFFKRGTGSYGALQLSGAAPGWNDIVTIDLDTGSTNVVMGALSAVSVTAFPNGWYRLSVSKTTTSSGTPQLRIATALDLSTFSYSGTGTGIYIWGAQLEAGAFATSYIPTTTATVTRSADVVSITGSAFSSWYRQDEGTVFVEFQARSGGRLFMFDNGTTNERWEGRFLSNTFQMTNWSNAIATMSGFTGSNFNDLQRLKGAHANKTNDAATSSNGITPDVFTGGVDNSTTIAANQSRLFIGSFQGTATYANGPISRLTYFPQRLSNTTLQSLTQ